MLLCVKRFFLGIIVIGFCFSLFGCQVKPPAEKTKERIIEQEVPAQESQLITKPEPRKLNAYTKNQANEYARFLLSIFAVKSDDPFNLDEQARSKLSSVKEKISGSGQVCVFNGQIFSSLELFEDNSAFYLRPQGGISGATNMLEVIKQEKIYPEDLLKGADDIETAIYRIFYEAKVNNAADAQTKLKAYLDLAVSTGKIESYDYSDDAGTLEIKYPDQEIPLLLEPSSLVNQALYVLDAYRDPKSYAQKTLQEYQHRMIMGEALLTYFKDNKLEGFFIEKSILKNYIDALLDSSLSKEQKIEKFTSQVNLSQGDQGEDLSFRGIFRSEAFAENADSGTIVPPKKDIFIMEMPDFEVKSEMDVAYLGRSFLLNRAKDINNGFLYPYLKNAYTISYEKISWNKQAVERLESVLNNENITNFILHTHGDPNKLIAELYDLGSVNAGQNAGKSSDYLKKLEDVVKRYHELKAKYGKGINFVRRDSLLPEKDMAYLSRFSAGLPASVKDLISENRQVFIAEVTDVFFSQYFKKKSVFILLACYGGSFADSVRGKARVFIAPQPNSETTGRLFRTDLEKVAPYLLKKSSAIDTNKVTLSNHRNYNIMNDFIQGQFLVNDDVSGDQLGQLTEDCVAKKDTLCSLKLYASDGESVSVSPHVQEVAPEFITFNAPMNTANARAESIAQLNCFQCGKQENSVLELKPVWDGDKKIKLPWNNKVYRAWNDNDFDGSGNPKSKSLAYVRVKTGAASSKDSFVWLTGNTEACVESLCFHPESYRDPANPRYNGNRPDTDFTMVLPCVTAGYYQGMCKENRGRKVKIVDNQGRYSGAGFPEKIRVNGVCFQKIDSAPVDAEEVESWQEDDGCSADQCNKKPVSAGEGNGLHDCEVQYSCCNSCGNCDGKGGIWCGGEHCLSDVGPKVEIQACKARLICHCYTQGTQEEDAYLKYSEEVEKPCERGCFEQYGSCLKGLESEPDSVKDKQCRPPLGACLAGCLKSEEDFCTAGLPQAGMRIKQSSEPCPQNLVGFDGVKYKYKTEKKTASGGKSTTWHQMNSD